MINLDLSKTMIINFYYKNCDGIEMFFSGTRKKLDMRIKEHKIKKFYEVRRVNINEKEYMCYTVKDIIELIEKLSTFENLSKSKEVKLSNMIKEMQEYLDKNGDKIVSKICTCCGDNTLFKLYLAPLNNPHIADREELNIKRTENIE